MARVGASGSRRGGQRAISVGGLNEEKVDKTFQSALSDFQRCIDDGAKRVEFLGGSVSFLVKIDTHGKVDHAHLEKSTIGDRDTEKCMLDSLRAKRWPKPVGGEHGLARKSFDFDPPNDVRAPRLNCVASVKPCANGWLLNRPLPNTDVWFANRSLMR